MVYQLFVKREFFSIIIIAVGAAESSCAEPAGYSDSALIIKEDSGLPLLAQQQLLLRAGSFSNHRRHQI